MTSDDAQDVVASALAPIAPVLAIADHREIAPTESKLLRLDLTDETWEDAAKLMIGAAKGIALMVSEITPPILFELRAILDAGRGQDAIVFVGEISDPSRDLIVSALGGDPRRTNKAELVRQLMSQIDRPHSLRKVILVSDKESTRLATEQWAADLG